MTQRDDGHDFRDSKNKSEAYERKKKEDREQAQRLIDKWNVWKYDAMKATNQIGQMEIITIANLYQKYFLKINLSLIKSFRYNFLI